MAKHKNQIGMSLSALGQATREGLLDHVYKNTGCEYLSDLHDIRYRQTALELVLEAADDNYSLREWSDCLSYVLQANICGASVEEIKKMGRDYAIRNHMID